MSRTYVVFRDDQGAWKIVSEVEANDAEHAVRQLAAAPEDGGLYAAVPKRNFTQVRVTIEPAKPRIVLTVQR